MKVLGVVALSAAFIAAATAFYGWMVMLFVGLLWHEFGVLKPIGFWLSCAIGLLFSILTAPFKSGSKGRD